MKAFNEWLKVGRVPLQGVQPRGVKKVGWKGIEEKIPLYDEEQTRALTKEERDAYNKFDGPFWSPSEIQEWISW